MSDERRVESLTESVETGDGTRASGSGPEAAPWRAGRPSGSPTGCGRLHPGLDGRARRDQDAGRPRPRTRRWPRIGGTGLFTKEIQRALLDGRGRGRRPQPEGPADAGARRPDPRRRAAARGRGRRPDRPGLPDPRRPARRGDRGHRLAPPPGAAPPPAAGPGRGGAPGERRDPAEPGARGPARRRGPGRGGPAPAGAGRARHRAARPAAVPAGGGAGGSGDRMPGRRRGDRSPCSPRSTTRRPAAPCWPSAAPWPSSKAAA